MTSLNIDDKLGKLIENSRKQAPFSWDFSSDKSDFVTQIYPPWQLKANKWVVGLINLQTYNAIKNITNENNRFIYSVDKGATWKTITLPVGCYEITDINNAINSVMISNGDESIIIDANAVTLGTFIKIPNENYQIDFTKPRTIAETLGFNSRIIKYSINHIQSDRDANINKVKIVLINCSIIKNSYVNSSPLPVIYSFSINVAPGFQIVKEPVTIRYLPINSDTITSIRIWATDQDGNKLDFGENGLNGCLYLNYI